MWRKPYTACKYQKSLYSSQVQINIFESRSTLIQSLPGRDVGPALLSVVSCIQESRKTYMSFGCRKSLPYLMQAVKQGLQDIGASSIEKAHSMVFSGELRMEVRSSGAQAEGNVHHMHTYHKQLW